MVFKRCLLKLTVYDFLALLAKPNFTQFSKNVHTVPKGSVKLFGVPESGKDIFSLHISPKLDIKLNQTPKSSCASKN